MNQLYELAEKYKIEDNTTAKATEGRYYVMIYDELFKYRKNNIKKVLEIGILTGISHKIWRDYFPNAQIYGIDNQEHYLIQEDRIKSFLIDQSNQESLEKVKELVGENIDIIIDDGSHIPDDQILSVKILLNLLNENGLYIIEDVGNSEPIRKGLNDLGLISGKDFMEIVPQYSGDAKLFLIKSRNNK